MKTTLMKRLIGSAVLAGVALSVAPAQAQEIQLRGPLAGARSVSRLVRYREGRISLTPTFGVTIQDQFSRDLFAGLRAEYNIADWLAVGAWGAFAVSHIDTSLTDQVVQKAPGGTANVPDHNHFSQQVGRRNWMADLHVSFIPLRGKFALFQNLVADVDFFIFAGAAFIGVEERQSTDSLAGGGLAPGANPISLANQVARDGRVAIAPTFGAGLNFFFNRFMSLNVEYRAFPFAWNTSGTDESSTATRCGPMGNASCAGFSDYVATYFDANQRTRINAEDRIFHFNQMINFGLTFYLPTAPRIGP